MSVRGLQSPPHRIRILPMLSISFNKIVLVGPPTGGAGGLGASPGAARRVDGLDDDGDVHEIRLDLGSAAPIEVNATHTHTHTHTLLQSILATLVGCSAHSLSWFHHLSCSFAHTSKKTPIGECQQRRRCRCSHWWRRVWWSAVARGRVWLTRYKARRERRWLRWWWWLRWRLTWRIRQLV